MDGLEGRRDERIEERYLQESQSRHQIFTQTLIIARTVMFAESRERGGNGALAAFEQHHQVVAVDQPSEGG